MDTTQKIKRFHACPFCGGKIARKYTGLNDRLGTTSESFDIYECLKCQGAILNPAPVGDVSRFYPMNYLSSEQARPADNRFDLEKWYRYNQYRYDFNLFERATGKTIGELSSYVDIGCGSGERVAFVREYGTERSYGIDKFDFAKKRARQGSTIINSDIIDFKPREKFQLGSLFHVLEHLENPEQSLRHIKTNILSRGGYLIIQVPNYGSFERRLFRGRWFGLDAPRHYWHFNEKALKMLLQDTGFKIEASYQLNAPLHSVTLVPSIMPELDVQRIWVNRSKNNNYKTLMKMLWAGMTIASVPITLAQNLLNRSSMLTIIASVK